MAKNKIIKARIEDAQWDKLEKILKIKGLTVSQWVRRRIELAREK